MPSITVSADVDLQYTDVGSGQPIVFVHGGHMSKAVWRHQEASLAPEYRVIAVDLRGHGESDKPYCDYSIETFADDLAALVDGLDLNDPVVVGWSVGAQVVAEYLGRDPDAVDGVVFVSSVLFDRIAPDVEAEIDVDGLVSRQQTNQPAAMLSFVSDSLSDGVGEPTRRWLWRVAMGTPVYVGVNHLRSLESLSYERIADSLQDVTVPALVVHGALDDVTSDAGASHFATEVLGSGRAVTFDDSAHFSFIEESARFTETLVDFLESDR